MTTGQGGDLTKCNSAGCGVIFKLSQTQTGGWKETVLHTFTGSDGQNPVGNLELDQAGNLFGATSSGGAANGGTVFELSPNPAGGWKETLLRSFAASRFSDGWAPAGGVVIDSAGNVYGTTYTGGVKHSCCGTVFELSPGSRNWTETVLHAFSGPNDGSSPAATLASIRWATSTGPLSMVAAHLARGLFTSCRPIWGHGHLYLSTTSTSLTERARGADCLSILQAISTAPLKAEGTTWLEPSISLRRNRLPSLALCTWLAR
jgi:uncharacterized repeat protein (TIGR03803 family)